MPISVIKCSASISNLKTKHLELRTKSKSRNLENVVQYVYMFVHLVYDGSIVDFCIVMHCIVMQYSRFLYCIVMQYSRFLYCNVLDHLEGLNKGLMFC